MPQPRTATVRPSASSAPRCASPSTPRARPLTTTTPAAARSRPSIRATCSPYDEHARAPTTATAVRPSNSGEASPRRYNRSGGSWIARSSGGRSRLRRKLTRRPVRERFGDVLWLDAVGRGERGDRAGDGSHLRTTPSRQAHALHGVREQPVGGGVPQRWILL